MSKVFIEESSLTAIGDAIRSKTGGTGALSVPSGMVNAISSITTGGGSGGGGVDITNGSLIQAKSKQGVVPAGSICSLDTGHTTYNYSNLYQTALSEFTQTAVNQQYSQMFPYKNGNIYMFYYSNNVFTLWVGYDENNVKDEYEWKSPTAAGTKTYFYNTAYGTSTGQCHILAHLKDNYLLINKGGTISVYDMDDSTHVLSNTISSTNATSLTGQNNSGISSTSGYIYPGMFNIAQIDDNTWILTRGYMTSTTACKVYYYILKYDEVYNKFNWSWTNATKYVSGSVGNTGVTGAMHLKVYDKNTVYMLFENSWYKITTTDNWSSSSGVSHSGCSGMSFSFLNSANLKYQMKSVVDIDDTHCAMMYSSATNMLSVLYLTYNGTSTLSVKETDIDMSQYQMSFASGNIKGAIYTDNGYIVLPTYRDMWFTIKIYDDGSASVVDFYALNSEYVYSAQTLSSGFIEKIAPNKLFVTLPVSTSGFTAIELTIHNNGKHSCKNFLEMPYSTDSSIIDHNPIYATHLLRDNVQYSIGCRYTPWSSYCSHSWVSSKRFCSILSGDKKYITLITLPTTSTSSAVAPLIYTWSIVDTEKVMIGYQDGYEPAVAKTDCTEDSAGQVYVLK